MENMLCCTTLVLKTILPKADGSSGPKTFCYHKKLNNSCRLNAQSLNHFTLHAPQIVFMKNLTERPETTSMTQFSLFEDEVGPGVVKTLLDFSFAEVKIFVPIKQVGHIWLPYRLMKEELAMNRQKFTRTIALQV